MTRETPWLGHYDPGVNATLAPYPTRTLLDYVSESAARDPHHPAILFKGSTLTFSQLERLSDAFGAALASLGVARGDRVALVLPNCPQFSIAQYGAWKIGAVVAPLNPIYTERELEGPLGDHGDVYDRYMIRALEMRESLKILNKAIADIPAGPIMDPKAKLRGFRPKAGEAYGRIEAPKGELGFYLISDGSPNPYRYRVRPPSFINLTALEQMCLGHTVADVVGILGSLDIVLGEVDR